MTGRAGSNRSYRLLQELTKTCEMIMIFLGGFINEQTYNASANLVDFSFTLNNRIIEWFGLEGTLKII